MGRESLFFYLRILFLPFIIPLSIGRAWTSSWDSLERTHREQEDRYRQMLLVLPPRMRRQVEEGNGEQISAEPVRRFAALLGDYVALRSRLPGAREASMKSQYLNVLDACSRRLRLAQLRQQQAVDALGPRPNSGRGRPRRRRPSR